MADEHQRLHDALRDDLFKRQLSNSETLAKAILSLSSAGLGLSLLFLRYSGKSNLGAIENVVDVHLLYRSWLAFLLAIGSTLVSFVTSQIGIKKQLKLNKQYYLERKEEVINQKNWWAWVTTFLNYSSVGFYIVALCLTVEFVKRNTIGG